MICPKYSAFLWWDHGSIFYLILNMQNVIGIINQLRKCQASTRQLQIPAMTIYLCFKAIIFVLIFMCYFFSILIKHHLGNFKCGLKNIIQGSFMNFPCWQIPDGWTGAGYSSVYHSTTIPPKNQYLEYIQTWNFLLTTTLA